ncbi:MAG: FAD synthetase family protein [Bacteroidales bacterium]|nr:FAD synthetase family protein [Bacteroidales bacterium]
MTIYRNFNHIEGEYTACIGFFDGVHRGHQYLLQRVKEMAAQSNTKAAAVTFANHPRQVIDPSFELLLIDTLEQRMDKLEKMGLDACFLIDFTEEVRNMTAKEFIQDFLCRMLHVKQLIIGYDHRFGRNRSEGFEDYVVYGAECGMRIVKAPVFEDNSGLHYSSSEVRRAIAAGDMNKAHQLLGW